MKFNEIYWQENFSDPESMDGIGNRSFHARYLKYLFLLDGIQPSSIIDLGFGMGYLFDELKRVFKPSRSLGIEPSTHIFQQYLERIPHQDKDHLLENIGIGDWLKKNGTYDLGICTSVFQYLTDKELEKYIPKISKRVRFLYLTVPTDKELKIQREDHDFKDHYAISRSRTKYLRYLRPHFTFISSRLLESKFFYNTDNTHFNEFLYRF